MCPQNMSRNGDLCLCTGFKIGSKATALQFENDFPDVIIAD